MKYFSVTAKHGHMATGRYMPITFAIRAESIFSAIDYAKTMPGVKHDSPSVILDAHEITACEYMELRKCSAYERMYKNAYKKSSD